MQFTAPEINIVMFGNEDIITASFGGDSYWDRYTTTTMIGIMCPAELPMD